ncbi:MAG: hypothetical protein ABI717_09185 [Actinomycetota bacterium]
MISSTTAVFASACFAVQVGALLRELPQPFEQFKTIWAIRRIRA